MGSIKAKKINDEEFLKNLQLLDQLSSQEISFKAEDIEKGKKQEKTLEERQKEAELNRFDQDTTHRSSLITWAATIVSLWLICVIFILTRNTQQYKLSDTIVVTLLTTTTVNVLGLMIIVLNDLFKGKAKTKKKTL
jgi:hypothetical protein